MNIDRNIEFRFCTRTLSEGHRVFYDDGRETLSFTEEFDPVMRKHRQQTTQKEAR